MGKSHAFVSVLVAVVTSFSSARTAFAQSDPVVAEALFQEGRSLLDQGKPALACPKLAESHRLDPATGTLIALALCREAEGKLASAWAAFADAEGRARTEGSQDREAVAHERAAALYPRLSTLSIDVSEDASAIAGLEIKRDGVVLGRGAWGTKVPIDGGEHVVEASAPGKQPWRSTVSVQTESDHVRLSVPALVDLPTAHSDGQKPALPKETDDLPQPASATEPWGGLEWAGVSVAIAGAAALGVSGYFLSDALDKKEQADPDCDPNNQCNSQGLAKLDDAVESGNKATLLSIAGGVLLAGGSALFLVGRLGGSAESGKTGTSVFVAFEPGGAALRLERGF